MKKRMLSKTLDLHGTRHEKVVLCLENFYFWQGRDTSYSTIITGNSPEMQAIVSKWLDNYQFSYYIEPHNLGRIIVTE